MLYPSENFPDYHIHSPYCRHAQGKMINYVKSAIQKKITEMAFTDHLGRYYLTSSQKKRYWDWGMSNTAVIRYISEITHLQKLFSDIIQIRTGLEVDYIEGAEDILKPILEIYPFDLLLTSIHCIPSLGWKHLSNYDTKETWPIFKAYFSAAQSAINSGIFDCLAHLDFIWRYVKWPETHSDEVFELITDTVKLAAEKNFTLEINANAYLWSHLYIIKQGDPFQYFLSQLKKYDVDITIGSDAHQPQFVGKNFSDIAQCLKKHNINKLAVFSNRKKRIIKIT